jgi:hypothetical protein
MYEILGSHGDDTFTFFTYHFRNSAMRQAFFHISFGAQLTFSPSFTRYCHYEHSIAVIITKILE